MARESDELTHAALLARRSWEPIPSVAVLHGDAAYFKREILERFARELARQGGEPWIRKITPQKGESSPSNLAQVLEDLRTPSFLSPTRLVIIDPAESFIALYRDELEPLPGGDFQGGHLVLVVDQLDQRTRFARAVKEKGWRVACLRPFDRPPPWKPGADPWDHDLARWIVSKAKEKHLGLDLELAHALSERSGNDLATLAEELEKIATYLSRGSGPAAPPGGKGSGKKISGEGSTPARAEAPARVTLETVNAVAGDLREDSIFDLVDAFLRRDRTGAHRISSRLLRSGYHPEKGSPVQDPAGIWSLFVGAVIQRLRALRRAHALAAEGRGPDDWIALRLTPKPFLPRFERDLRTASPARIEYAFEALRRLDRGVKTGGDAERAIEEAVLRL